jgi:hypothetical protein
MHKIKGCVPCLCIEKLKLGEKGVVVYCLGDGR